MYLEESVVYRSSCQVNAKKYLGLELTAASCSQIKTSRANTTPLWRNGSAQDCGFALVPADKSE